MRRRFFEIRYNGKAFNAQGYPGLEQAALSIEDAPEGSEIVEVTNPVAGRVLRTFNLREALRAKSAFLKPQIP
jgi:hypothetical protein